MKLTQPDQRPLALPAACISVADAPVVGRHAAWAPPASEGPARLLAARGRQSDGINVPTYKIAGAGIPTVNARFTGDVRGIPPRGRPV